MPRTLRSVIEGQTILTSDGIALEAEIATPLDVPPARQWCCAIPIRSTAARCARS